jgi:hypothetical protein
MCSSDDGTMRTVCTILPKLDSPGALAPRWACFFRINPCSCSFSARATLAAASLSGIPTIKPSRVRGSVVIALLCGNRIVLSDLGFVVQNGVQQRLVNSYFGVVIDEAYVVIDEA